jgi:hypothetical protein
MNSFTKLLSFALRIAFWLGLTGGLADFTIAMMKQAGQAHQQGLIPLTHLNRALGIPLTK